MYQRFRINSVMILLALALVTLGTAGIVFAQDNDQQQQQQRNEALKEAVRQRRAEQAAQREQQNSGEEKQRAPARQPRTANTSRNSGESRAASRKKSDPSLGEFSVAVDAEASMLRIHPKGKSDRQDYLVIVGQEFDTEITLENRGMVPFDEFRVFLSFDPEYLEPMSVNDSTVAPRLAQGPTAEVDPLYGILLYEAQLEEPMVLNDVPLLTIRWRAKKVNLETPIEFSSREDRYTTVVGNGMDLLGNPRVPDDGTLNMRVSIMPEDPRAAEAMMSDPLLYAGEGEKIGGVKMYIRPPEKPVVVGEPFSLDLVLDNRAFSNLDGIGVLLEYDPDILEVVDADHNNYITLERNIHDGPFHDQFPWTFHIDNVVYQHRGLISYRVGTGDGNMTRGKVGTFARIYAVAKRPTQGTPIVFKFVRQERVRGTEATYNGKDALGDPKVFNDGAEGVLLTVLPATDPEQAARVLSEL